MKLRAASKILEVLDFWDDSRDGSEMCINQPNPLVDQSSQIIVYWFNTYQSEYFTEYPKKFIKYLEEHEWYFTHTPWPELSSFVIHNKPRNTQNQFNVTGPLKTAKPKNRKK